jgi:hypothetical protein
VQYENKGKMFELSKSFYLRTQGALLERSLPIHVKALAEISVYIGRHLCIHEHPS